MSRLLPLPAKATSEYRWLVGRRLLSSVHEEVRRVLAEVRQGGDRAVLNLTERFDGVRLVRTSVPRDEWEAALNSIPAALRYAIEEMARRVEAVHRAQQFQEDAVEPTAGVRAWREWRPFRRVGLYAPGGRTVYPSSVVMMAVPARIAGCPEIVLCSPPQRDGRPAPAILAAAAITGITEVHAIGGAQAIAALAYGTDAITPVDLVAGPGNRFVTAAKIQVFGEVAIDMPAGPSELVIISDGSVNTSWLGADLRAQAEHAPDAIAILVTTSHSDAAVVDGLAEGQVKGYLVESLEAALAFANDFAPEHLMLAVNRPEEWLPHVSAAGSVFLGPYAGAAAGDYATGANHVLPTGGSARSFGALGVRTFGRPLQVQQVAAEGLPALVAITDVLADAEHLPWHGASIRVRSER